MKTILLRFSVLLLFVPLLEFPATSQNNISDASIFGTLVDASGGAVSEVEVTAALEGQTGAPVASASSKVDGHYTLAVPAGRYRVRFVRSPFRSVEQVVELRSGESHTLDLRLALERLSSLTGWSVF